MVLTEKFGFDFVRLPNIIELSRSIACVRLRSTTEHSIAYPGCSLHNMFDQQWLIWCVLRL